MLIQWLRYLINKGALIVGLLLVAWGVFAFKETYDDHYQKVRVSESDRFGWMTTAAIAQYFELHEKYPDKLESVVQIKPEEFYVGKPEFNNKTGVLIVMIDRKSLSEGALIYFPQQTANNKVSYLCQAVGLSKDFLDGACVEAGRKAPSVSEPSANISTTAQSDSREE